MRFASGRLMHALVDWEVEVAQHAKIADPVFEILHDGVKGSLVAGYEGGELGPVEVDLVIQRVVLLQQVAGNDQTRESRGNATARSRAW